MMQHCGETSEQEGSHTMDTHGLYHILRNIVFPTVGIMLLLLLLAGFLIVDRLRRAWEARRDRRRWHSGKDTVEL
jgi:hypothetical protein